MFLYFKGHSRKLYPRNSLLKWFDKFTWNSHQNSVHIFLVLAKVHPRAPSCLHCCLSSLYHQRIIYPGTTRRRKARQRCHRARRDGRRRQRQRPRLWTRKVFGSSITGRTVLPVQGQLPDGPYETNGERGWRITEGWWTWGSCCCCWLRLHDQGMLLFFVVVVVAVTATMNQLEQITEAF